MIELELMRMFMAMAAEHLPHLRIFRREIVNSEVSRGGRSFHAKAGIKGQADLYAIVDGGGHVEIETKSKTGRLSEEQQIWQSFCLARRIPYLRLKAHRGEAPVETVERWVFELRQVAK